LSSSTEVQAIFVVCFLLGNSPAVWISNAGELPKRKHTTFRTLRKFEIKNTRYLPLNSYHQLNYHTIMSFNWRVLFPVNIILQVISGFMTLLIYFEASNLKWNWSVHVCIFVSALLWYIWGTFNVNLIFVSFVFHHFTAIFFLWAVLHYGSSPQTVLPCQKMYISHTWSSSYKINWKMTTNIVKLNIWTVVTD
jgi:hypothetical protein